MDFLDPKKKRARSVRLAIGHSLMGILVVIGTYILVSQAYGFDVDTKTGAVIQNGLAFIDSAPDGAKIFMNGDLQKSNTNTRLALPEGHYSIEIQKEGYRSWKRDFNLLGGTVERFTYPMLIPNDLKSTNIQAFTGLPSLGLQSPDRRWVLVANSPTLGTFTQYDLNTLKDKKPTPSSVVFPATIFTTAAGAHSLELVEWSTDNKHVLVKHNFSTGSEFLMLNRDEPGSSININKTLNLNPTKIALRDKRFDELYLYTSAGGVLQSVTMKDKVATPVLTGVISFKPHGNDVLLYSQNVPGDLTKTRVSLKEGDKTYIVREMPAAANVPLEIARYSGSWYVAVGSDAEQKAYVYKDPADFLDHQKDKKPVPITVLKATGPINVLAFSQNTRFIMVNNGQHFSVYDAENDKTYSYNVAEQFDQTVKPEWMDGHRILVNASGKTMIFDFDGVNVQTLTANEKTLPVSFNRDYTYMYTLSPQARTVFNFDQTPLRTDKDL